VLALWLVIQPAGEAQQTADRPGLTHRMLVDAQGITYTYAYSRPLGLALSAAVGFLSSLLGIGGGIIHVPAMVQLLHIPAHIATATSLFVLALTSLTGSVTHALIAGAQGGAVLSAILRGSLIVRLLALALGLVGLRLVLGVL
jgi:uncharacterized membrane protein YfcA